jgi:hypothetical protein
MRKLFLALLLFTCSARCASVVHGRYQDVAVSSTPSGAAVRVDCGDAPADAGVTPAKVKLRRGAEHCAITLSKSGYSDHVVTFTRMVSEATWGNIVPGLLIGTVIAAASAPIVVFSDSAAQEDRANGLGAAGVIGGAGAGAWIDHSTGAMYKQVPGTVDVTLQPRQP